MIVYLILSVLLGSILGRFCNFLAVILACTFVLFIFILRFAYAEHSLVRSLFEYVVLITSLQIGYFLSVISDGRLRRRDEQVAAGRPKLVGQINKWFGPNSSHL